MLSWKALVWCTLGWCSGEADAENDASSVSSQIPQKKKKLEEIFLIVIMVDT